MNNKVTTWAGCLTPLVALLVFAAAWLTHVMYCIDHEKWGFLIAGALAFPIAIIHGFGIWFGFWH